MKTCSKCAETKPITGFCKSKLGVLGVRGDCRKCVAAYDAERYASAAERQRELARQRRAAEPSRHRGYVKAYYARNAESIRSKARAKHDPVKSGERSRRWRQRNPDKHCASVMAREADKLRATPQWADKEKILSFYADAQRLTAETGEKHHVDHIYPLRGKRVCGLHNQFNLQVLPARVNQKKYNLMPEESTRRAEMRL
jgi:hypothetical protein